MTQPQQGFAIGVDLGTSNTVAVIRHPDGRTRPLLVDGAPIMPSGVYVDEHGRIHVGRDAQRMAGLDPSRFEPNPKRRIDEPAVLLGDREINTVDLLAAILAAVARASVEAVGFLPPAILTYPAAWGSRRRDTLAEAARRAGWPPVRLTPEPVAAARYFADVLRRPVAVGSSLAVFDFGGGTLDIAIVRNDNGRFSVIGSGGLEDLGGLDVDAAIVEHLGNVIAQTAQGAWAALQHPTTTTQRRDRRLFWDDIRGAKEMLSRSTNAPITVPGQDQALHLTREELERVTDPLIRRAVWETGKVIHSAGLRPDQLAGLFLVGGSSRLPLAARLLHAELGIAPTVLEQPELPVAEGALAELVPAVAYQTESIPVSGMPMAPHSTPPSAPASAPPAAPISPVSGGFGGAPVSVAPMGYGQGGPPSAQFPAPPSQRIPVAAPPRMNRTGLLLGAVAAVVVLALVGAAGYWFFFRDRVNPVDFKTVSAAGSLALGDKINYPVTATLGSRTYALYTTDKNQVHLVAYDLDDKKKIWQYDLGDDNYRWNVYPNPSGVMLIGSGGTVPVLVLVGEDGKQKAKQEYGTSDAVYFLADVWIQHSVKTKKTNAYDWAGKYKWTLDDDKNSTDLLGPIVTGDQTGPSDLTGAPTNRDLKSRTQFITIDGDTINLRNQSSKIVRSWSNTAGSSAKFAMYGERLFVYGSSTKYTVKAYDLSKDGEPEQLFTAPDDKRQIEDVAACGTDRLCVLDSDSSAGSTILRSISVTDKKQVWQGDAKGTSALIPVGKSILATTPTGSTPSSRLFGEDGSQVLKPEDQGAFGARVTNGSLLFFAKAPGAYDEDVTLTGVTVSSGDRIALGTLPKVAGQSCSWNATKIACVGDGKLQIWAFA
ncbi:Hsp70 family protein [Dactylosporangium vinaceum]|uniref:Hsp70 family protein n=1 Tax=Dactylosporangium vinaceum TaxID=53362 RepID=A0ABV5MLI3_9ACTN|nr:Hsp70 family protein [Dactylosporangium vinaceum]UAB96963.1 Hsp70 family protein [Dactylosporangium vinaceum]